MKPLIPIVFAAIALLPFSPCVAAGGKATKNPDLTNGESIPEGKKHDWALGATGLRGWYYTSSLSTHEARQIAVTEVAKGSPADGILKVGDVILGVAGKAFAYDARIEFGKALTAAETEKGGGKLVLLAWRDGKTGSPTIQVPVLGTYSATAPYDCPKSKRILEQGCEALAERMGESGYRPNSIVRSLNALALLASGNREYMPLVKREAEWAAQYRSGDNQSWWYGYVITFLSEYAMATGDQSVMAGLKRLAMESANGQSTVGSWSHGFVGEDGRLRSYGMMNAPGVPLTVALVLARKAGVDDPAVDLAIDRSARLLRFYAGKGAIPYGDHVPWMQTHEDNGKCGMAAVLFNLLGEPEPARFFTRMSVAAHGPERDYGHSTIFFNLAWAIPGVAQAGPQATGVWMGEFGAWYYDLARCWDGTFLHQAPPQAWPDTAPGWDATGAYLLSYAWPLQTLVLSGKGGVNKELFIDSAAAKSLIEDGKGWTRHDRTSFYDSLSEAELLDRLESWSPIVRDRAAAALARKPNPPMRKLLGNLGADRLETRYGACQAFAKLGKKASSALPELRKTLQADDLWLRILAADAIAAMGDAGMPALPDMLGKMAANGPSSEDPRGMEQRYLSYDIFGTMLAKRSLEGVDRDVLRQAIAAGLRNQDGSARTAISGIYQKLSLEELRPILPDIQAAIVEPAPSGIMFADGIRTAGLQLLAKHRIMEGLPLCLDVIDINRWGKRGRIPDCVTALELYGEAAKPELPRIRQVVEDLKVHREAKELRSSIDRLEKLIETIEKS